MRIGGFVFDQWNTPEEWANKALEMGYSAVYFPVDYTADTKVIDEFMLAAKEKDLIIAEIGVWNNVLDSDLSKRKENIQKAQRQLELADYINASCCVNISGSRAKQWDGPHKDNLTDETFEMVVQSVRQIIDAVNPKNTAYTLEPMPWMFPHTADSYLELIKAVDRKAFGVHLDPVNVINSLEKYYSNGEVITEWFTKLKPYIKSCHAKDIIIGSTLTLHFNECRPGTGELDYDTLIKCMNTLDKNTCLMFEHMTEKIDYVESMKFLKSKLI